MRITLFDLEYLPLTSAAGFLQAPFDVVVGVYDGWMGILERAKSRRAISESVINGLDALLPMSWPSTRLLFWSTRSRWTLLLDNAGGDLVSTAVSYLSADVLRCRGMRVLWTPHIRFKDGRGSLGGTILDVYGPDGPPHGLIRSISRIHESGWEFDTYGSPLPFERYSDSELKKHWSKDLLFEYARELGVELDDPNVFGESGVLYQEQAEWVKDVRVQTLEEAQYEMRLHEV